MGHLGAILAHPGAIPGPSLPILGPSWGHPGAVLGHTLQGPAQDPPELQKKDENSKFAMFFEGQLGTTLGPCWAMLERSWVRLGIAFGNFPLENVMLRENRRSGKKDGLKTRLGAILARFGRQKGSKMKAFWGLSWGK